MSGSPVLGGTVRTARSIFKRRSSKSAWNWAPVILFAVGEAEERFGVSKRMARALSSQAQVDHISLDSL
jgi:hypothetical protein